jgi:Ca-activated chloride channel family protein
MLQAVGDARIALRSVKVEAALDNLLARTLVRLVYRNLEAVNIEAVYTFPLPLGAVLLDMTIHTGERQLKGVVLEKTKAEEQYEQFLGKDAQLYAKDVEE